MIRNYPPIPFHFPEMMIRVGSFFSEGIEFLDEMTKDHSNPKWNKIVQDEKNRRAILEQG